MALNEFIKNALRISGNDYDDEVDGLIAAAERDLARVGIAVNENDALIVRAVVFYCKAYFGYDDSNSAEKCERAYEHLRTALALTADCRGGE